VNVDDALRALPQSPPEEWWGESLHDLFRRMDTDPRERRRIQNICDLLDMEDRFREQAVRPYGPESYEAEFEGWTEP
jgi:hypothetical protein